MANYIELPVYKASYDLLLQVFNLTHNLNRDSWTLVWKNQLDLAPEYLYNLLNEKTINVG